jgi:hypothetical protein
MKKSCLLIAFVVVAFLSEAQNALGSVGGVVASGGQFCGSAGTLYRNLAGLSLNFELGLSYQPANTGEANCTFSTSWKDASGHAQSLNVPLGGITSASSSLAAGGVISWTSSGNPSIPVNVQWQLERAPAQSVAAILPVGGPGQLPCASTGTLWGDPRW